jgi:hypothetical protein
MYFFTLSLYNAAGWLLAGFSKRVNGRPHRGSSSLLAFDYCRDGFLFMSTADQVLIYFAIFTAVFLFLV